ncbi:pancreatic lipase-related protein 2-like isoform X2 [Lithobates pipiens]
MLRMKTLTPFIVYCIILGAAKGKEVCYEDLGCFSDDPPWARTFQRPVAKLPWSPDKIDTQFFLLTRENPKHHQIISARNVSSFNTSSFQTSKKTILIAHGMSDRAENSWVSDMCHELLLVEDVNCIGVDWRHGSVNILQYVQAANNGRVVGAEIAYLLKRLQAELNYPPSNIHIIGHSLGAHVAGEAGRRVSGIRRITGLDPARIYFENTVEEVRLDSSDADFVDVIHTDTKMIIGAGIATPIGHFDFYPNGGQHMAGCPNKLPFPFSAPGMFKTLACSHFRSFLYYTHSIRFPDGFVSYPCSSYRDFTAGSCFPCPLQRCPTMGHHSEQYYNITDQKMKLYLNTGTDPQHFSSWRYKISLTLNGTAETLGKMYISLYGAGGNVTKDHLERGHICTGQMAYSDKSCTKPCVLCGWKFCRSPKRRGPSRVRKMYNLGVQGSSESLVPGDTYSKFIDSAVKLHPLDHVTFYWTPILWNILKKQLGAARIDVQTGEDGTISSFCAAGTVLDSVTQVLGPCRDLNAH